MKSSRRLLATGVALAALAGCGPSVDLATGIHQQVTDVLLGAPIHHALDPNDVPVPSFPGVVATGPVLPTPPTATPAPILAACPAADPLAYPPRAATQTLNCAPKPGRYAYRQHGTAKVGGKRVASLQKDAIWRVRTIKAPLPTESYAFSVTAPSFDGSTTTTDYAVMKPVVNISQTIPPTNIGIQPIGGGIYITKIVTHSHGATSTFAPLSPGVEVIGQPLTNSATWQGIGIDVTHALTMSIAGKVVGNHHVNACGQQLDAWRVQVKTTVFGLSENLSQTETYDVGSEYGGMLLAVKRSISGTTGGQNVEQEMTATINSIKPVATKKHSGRR